MELGLQHRSEMLFSNRISESFVSRCGFVWGRGMGVGWRDDVLTSGLPNICGNLQNFAAHPYNSSRSTGSWSWRESGSGMEVFPWEEGLSWSELEPSEMWEWMYQRFTEPRSPGSQQMQNKLRCKKSGDPRVHAVRWQDATKAKKTKLFQ